MGHKTMVNGTVYEVTGGRTLIDGTGYSIKSGKTLIGGTAYDIGFGVPYDPVFANNDWATIIAVCQAGICPDEWNIGDQKAMTIDGISFPIDIIGKEHDVYTDGFGIAPLTFQMHDSYSVYSMSDGGDGGNVWANSNMRNKWLPNILAKMPSEVQLAIKEVNKKTSVGSQSDAINTAAEKLFLLSEIEIFGSCKYSFSGEGGQYAYYAEGGETIKKRRTSNSATSNMQWWERSPHINSNTYFCAVNTSGARNYISCTQGLSVSAAFCF